MLTALRAGAAGHFNDTGVVCKRDGLQLLPAPPVSLGLLLPLDERARQREGLWQMGGHRDA